MPACPAPFPIDEAARVADLHDLGVLDTLPEQVFDDVVALASQICGTPIGLVSLIDHDRQWFKARTGVDDDETPRDLAFCAHAIVAEVPLFIVEDAWCDRRFVDNPFVTGAPHVRFYAGAPIVSAAGHALGTVCVIDTVPRVLTPEQARALQALSRQTAVLLEQRRNTLAAEAARAAAADSERRLNLITDKLPALVAYIDDQQRYRFLSAHIRRSFEIDLDATLGCTMREIRGEATYAQLAPHVEAALRGETATFVYFEQRADRKVTYESNYIPDVDAAGHVHGFYAMTFDITEHWEAQRELAQLARIDTLTGLPNRRQFDERLVEAMARARRSRRPMAVMFLDVDHFKSINDTIGHAGGDAVLCEFARRLRSAVRATDTVARLAGDEFVLLLEGVDSAADLDQLARKVVACIRPPFALATGARSVTTSAGVAVYDGAAQDAAELLAQADEALYAAKRQGRDRHVVR